jgi:hypothetical protein
MSNETYIPVMLEELNDLLSSVHGNGSDMDAKK